MDLTLPKTRRTYNLYIDEHLICTVNDPCNYSPPPTLEEMLNDVPVPTGEEESEDQQEDEGEEGEEGEENVVEDE